MTYIRLKKLADADVTVRTSMASGDLILTERGEVGGAIDIDDLVAYLGSSTSLATDSEVTAAITAAIAGVETPITGSNTFTPSMTFATPGDVSASYGATRAGSWRRVNDLVPLSVNLNTVTLTHTTASGRLRLTGLPPTASAIAGEESIIPVRYIGSAVELPRFANNLRWIVVGGTTYAELAFDTPYPVTRYDAYNLTTAFTAGEVITGGTSASKATIDWLTYESLGGTAAIDQNLYLKDVSAAFTPGETITGNAGGGGLIGGNNTHATGGTQYVTADHVTSGTAFIMQASGYQGILL